MLMETYFSLPCFSDAEAQRFVRALSLAHTEAAVTRHPEARGLIEARVQRLGASARVFLSASAIRLATRYELCPTIEEQHSVHQLPTDAEVMLKYEPDFTTPPRLDVRDRGHAIAD